MPRQYGLTLIELMITLVIAAVVLTMAVPSFKDFLANNRLVTQTNVLVGAINLARSEAVKRGKRVALCRTADPNAAAPACGGGANNWSGGWLVFVDEDNDGSYDAAAGDVLLQVGQPAPGTLTVKSNAAADANLVYAADGTITAGATAVYAICDDRGVEYGRQVQVNTVGRPRLIKGSAADPLPSCTDPTAT